MNTHPSALDIEQYRQEIEPASIKNLIDESVLLEMVRAFNFRFRKGAVLLYATREKNTDGSLEWRVLEENEINSSTADPRTEHIGEMVYFHPFCKALGETIGRKNCQCSDCDLAQRFVDDNRREGSVEYCWLGLKEPCAPIRIAGQTRAILIGGGQIVENSGHKDRVVAELRRHHGLGELIDPKSNHAISDAQLENLIRCLEESQDWAKPLDMSAEEVLLQVNEVAAALQKIVDQVFAGRRSAANHRLMSRMAQELARGAYGGPKGWWDNAKRIFAEMAEILSVPEIAIYTRDGSCFERIWASNAAPTTNDRIPTRKVFGSLVADTFHKLDRNHPEHLALLESLGLPGTVTAHLRHMDLISQDHLHFGTLILVVGELTDQKIDLAESFCQEVCLRHSIVSLLFHLQEKDAAFRKRVSEIAHSFRTPLQALICDLGVALKIPCIREDSEMSERLEESLDKLYDAKADVKLLLDESRQTVGPIDLGSLLSQIITDLRTLAEAQACTFTTKRSWPVGLVLVGDRARLRRAFINLMENAVKYSWREHFIGVDLAMSGNGQAKIRISNYGIGIPNDKINEIFGMGVRLEVADQKAAVRLGGGMGLPHAMEIIRDFGGTLEITSRPDPAKPRDSRNPNHNHITEVTVTLPVEQDRNQKDKAP